MSLDLPHILRETFVAQAEHHAAIGSTNDRAAELARHPSVKLPLLVTANRQTAGRGRGSNRWWTGPGAIAMSLLVEAETVGAAKDRSPLVALATGVAVAETLTPLLPHHQVGIHWPNDIFAGGRKLAGILVEVLPDRRHVIGIGLNTNNTLADAPLELQTTVCTLRDLSGVEHDPTTLLVRLLRNLDEVFAQLRSAPASVAERASVLCLQCGDTLTIELGDCATTGRCEGIAPDGALLLDTPTGRQRFASGVVRR